MRNRIFTLSVLTLSMILMGCSETAETGQCNGADSLQISGQEVPLDFAEKVRDAIGDNANVSETAINEAAHLIKSKYPNVTSSETLNLLAVAYCPLAKNDARAQSDFLASANEVLLRDYIEKK